MAANPFVQSMSIGAKVPHALNNLLYLDPESTRASAIRRGWRKASTNDLLVENWTAIRIGAARVPSIRWPRRPTKWVLLDLAPDENGPTAGPTGGIAQGIARCLSAVCQLGDLSTLGHKVAYLSNAKSPAEHEQSSPNRACKLRIVSGSGDNDWFHC